MELSRSDGLSLKTRERYADKGLCFMVVVSRLQEITRFLSKNDFSFELGL